MRLEKAFVFIVSLLFTEKPKFTSKTTTTDDEETLRNRRVFSPAINALSRTFAFPCIFKYVSEFIGPQNELQNGTPSSPQRSLARGREGNLSAASALRRGR